jgi:hypothetical protein
MGESPGYDLQLADMSPGLEELGLASADIQFVIPCWLYSYARVVDALVGTAGGISNSNNVANYGRLTLGVGRIAVASRRLHGRSHVLDWRHRQLRVVPLPVDIGRHPWLHGWGRRGGSDFGADRGARSRLLSRVDRRLLVNGVEAALLFQADAVDAAPLDIVWRRDTPDLPTTAVACAPFSIDAFLNMEFQVETYRRQPTSGGSPACFFFSPRLDPSPPPIGRGPVAPVTAVARRPASISTVSTPNAPGTGPCLTRAAAPNSWASSSKAACPCQRRLEAAVGTDTT